VTEELAHALNWTLTELEKAIPKRIGPPRQEPPVLVLLDGACEESCTSIGGVLIVPGGVVECFGTEVPHSIVAQWKTRPDQKQVIGQAEIFPALVARLTWSRHLRNRRVLYFIDNESARQALVKCYSPVLPSLRMITSCLAWDQANNSNAWYVRVPTHSNVADGPSRLAFTRQLEKLGATIVSPNLGLHANKGNVRELGK